MQTMKDMIAYSIYTDRAWLVLRRTEKQARRYAGCIHGNIMGILLRARYE